MVSKNEVTNLKIAVVGLGYVGLPLAVEFAKAGVRVIGFDVNVKRVSDLMKNRDLSHETSTDELKQASIDYSTDPKVIRQANFVIVAVPTPINLANQPDLNILENASCLVGQNLAKGAIVVYESTVYPGVTEDICVPIIEKESGLKCGKDWFVGYSPERVNPGDKEHTISKIVKVVSGMDKKTCDQIAFVYSLICKAGVHKTKNIKTAEAAKVIENTQRDLNIGLVNELSLLFNRLGIDTQEVLEAAGTKWNFLKFRPGLVGGHCIGVDPYYLVYKAQEVGFHSQIISAGRRVNDYMAEFVALEIISNLIRAKKTLHNAKVLVMGLTFKENVPDIRNSKITVTINKLKNLGMKIFGFDPNLTKKVINKEFGISYVPDLSQTYDVVIIATAHYQFKDLADNVLKILTPRGIIMDIPGLYREALKRKKNIIYKNL